MPSKRYIYIAFSFPDRMNIDTNVYYIISYIQSLNIWDLEAFKCYSMKMYTNWAFYLNIEISHKGQYIVAAWICKLPLQPTLDCIASAVHSFSLAWPFSFSAIYRLHYGQFTVLYTTDKTHSLCLHVKFIPSERKQNLRKEINWPQLKLPTSTANTSLKQVKS
jgi:hypothetical protein